MAKSENRREALDLPARERVELVAELSASLAPGEILVPDRQRDLIGALGSGPQAQLRRHDVTLPVWLSSTHKQAGNSGPASFARRVLS